MDILLYWKSYEDKWMSLCKYTKSMRAHIQKITWYYKIYKHKLNINKIWIEHMIKKSFKRFKYTTTTTLNYM
jgi:hypothetical protein